MATYHELPSQYNRLDSESPTTAYTTQIRIGESNAAVQINRTYIKWDLSSIPAGSTISAASITMTRGTDISDNARTISCYRVKRVVVNGQATWNVYSTGNNWETAGCAGTTNDREATDIGTGTQPASGAGDTTITLTAASVQEMITGGTWTNNGFLLKVDTETSDAWTYDTSATYLDITYTVPTGIIGGIIL